MEDDVGRHAVPPRRFDAPGAQTLEKRLRFARQICCRGRRPRSPPTLFRLAPGAQRHAALAFQHCATFARQPQRAIGLMIDFEQAERDALPDDGAPFARAALGADAECAQPLVAVLHRLVGALAAQHVDDVHRAEALAGAIYAGEELLCRDRAIEGRRRIEADVAVAARRDRLAEIAEQPRAAALGAFAKAEHRVELGRLDALLRLAGLGFVDHAAKLHDVLQAVGHPRVRGQPVAPGAAGLLVVALDALRQVEVRDEAHVRLVDTHAESDGRDHDEAILALEALLVPAARFGLHAGVIRESRNALRLEEGRRLIGLLARQAVDDARFAGMLGTHEVEELAA